MKPDCNENVVRSRHIPDMVSLRGNISLKQLKLEIFSYKAQIFYSIHSTLQSTPNLHSNPYSTEYPSTLGYPLLYEVPIL